MVPTATDRGETQQAVQVNRRFGSWNECSGQRVVIIQLQDFDAARIVTSVPLDVDTAVFSDTLTKRRRELLSHILRNLSHRANHRRRARIFQEHGSSAAGYNHGLAIGRQVARTTEMITPIDPSRLEAIPRFAAPAIAVKSDDLFHEVPCPRHVTVGLNGIYLRTKCHKVRTIVHDHRCAEDRIAAVDLLGHLTGDSIDHVVVARGSADVEVLLNDRRRAGVVTVGCATASLSLPHHAERLAVNAEDNAGTINDIDASVRNHGRGKDRVAQGHSTDQPQRRCYSAIRYISAVT